MVCISYRPDFNQIHITPETKNAEQCCIQLHAQAPVPYDDSNHVMSSSGIRLASVPGLPGPRSVRVLIMRRRQTFEKVAPGLSITWGRPKVDRG